jgi:hypothetical protein
MLGTEGIQLEFTEDAVAKSPKMTAELNKTTENIGARRLHTLLEKLLEEISFLAMNSRKNFRLWMSDMLSTGWAGDPGPEPSTVRSCDSLNVIILSGQLR